MKDLSAALFGLQNYINDFQIQHHCTLEVMNSLNGLKVTATVEPIEPAITKIEPTKPEPVKPEPQYREVKRAAKVGEKIKITGEIMTGGNYKYGDILTMKSREIGHPLPAIGVEEFTEPHIFDAEYVVLEEIKDV